MVAPHSTPRPQNRLTSILALMVLGLWQIRQVWRFFTLVTLGMLAAVVLVCALPLFTLVTTTVGVRNAFNNGLYDPTSYVQMQETVASSAEIQQAASALTRGYRQMAGRFFSSPPVRALQIPYSSIAQNNHSIPYHIMQLHGYDTAHIVSHIPLVQGHFPQPHDDTLEIALTESNVQSLHARLGSSYTLYVQPAKGSQVVPVQLTVVGILQDVSFLDPFWHGDGFVSTFNPDTRITSDNAIISNDALLQWYDHRMQENGGTPISFSTSVNYYFPLDISAVNSANLDAFSQQLSKLSRTIPTFITQPDMQNIRATNDDLITLVGAAKDQTSASQVPLILMLILMLTLILFFARIMTELLVTRQAEAIALPRTRGATLTQIFLTFVSQSLLLGLITLVVSPLLLIVITRFLVQVIFTGADQQALNVLPATPWGITFFLGWYLLAAVTVAVGAMCAAIWRTLTSSTLGRSAPLASHPFWQRMYLDLLLLLVGTLFYSIYSYLTSTGLIDAQLQVLLTGPCILVATLLVCVGGVLLCARGFPWLVRLAARLTARRRGVAPMLPLVLLARTPRQAVRSALLLAMAIAFALFTLVFTATQAQRVYDLADYRTGADFSGPMQQASVPYIHPTPISIVVQTSAFPQEQSSLQASYRHIPGMLSASIGYNDVHYFFNAPAPVNVIAIDSTSFASSVIWSQQHAGQSNQQIAHLMAHMADERPLLTSPLPNTVMPALPAIVDTVTAHQLHLSLGHRFILSEFGGQMPLVDIGEIEHIPALNDGVAPEQGGQTGILVDYTSFVYAYERFFPNNNKNLNPNFAWLHTQQDATSLSIVRRSLASGPFALGVVRDRSLVLQRLQHDPLYLGIQLALALGVGLSLLLALIGNITSVWLSVRNRLRGLAVLRAIGTTPRQLMGLLAWEQGVTSAFAIMLGIGCGIGFTALALPSLVFSSLAQTGSLSNAYTANIYLLQLAPPLNIVIPGVLWSGMATVIVLCVVTLGITTYTAGRPSLGQALRGEDYVEEVPLFVARASTRSRTSEATAQTAATPAVAIGGANVVREQQHARVGAAKQRVGRVSLTMSLSSRALTPLRSAWGYLTLTGTGITLAVILVCLVPLFSQGTETAGLRDLLAQPANQYATVPFASSLGSYGLPFSAMVQGTAGIQRNLNTDLLTHSQPFFRGPAIMRMLGSVLVVDDKSQVVLTTSPYLVFMGVSSRDLSRHARIIQGQMPRPASILQIALTPRDAATLHVRVGELLTPQMGYLFPMQVVGLFQPAAADPFIPLSQTLSQDAPVSGYANPLVSTEGFLQMAAAQEQTEAQTKKQFIFSGEIAWYYPINSAHVTSNQLNPMIATFSALVQNGDVQRNGLPLDALTQYQTSIQISQVPVLTISALIIGLILLFLGFMAELLVEQETATIAVVRSRGATRRQVFQAFFERLLMISVGSVLLGLVLVMPVMMTLAHFVLSSTDQSVLQQATGQPLLAVLSLYPYILGCLAVMLLALSIVLYRAIGANILTLRQETTRSRRKPLWQRYYLDIAGIVLALAVYGASLYVEKVGILNAQMSVLVKSPLVVVTTVCLVLACILVFLRLFPLLLRLGTSLALRNSKRVEPMLALSQMARTPRQHMRVILLLMVTTAFVVFVSIFTASQSQHLNDVVQYWTGADLSGPLAASVSADHAARLQAAYQHLPGVTSVAMGNVSTFADSTNALVKVVAVDPVHFFQTVSLPGGTSLQQSTLIQQLTDQRSRFVQAASGRIKIRLSMGGDPTNALPVIVDSSLWNAYQLSPGQYFTLYGAFPSTFRVVGQVNYIPSTGDSQQFSDPTSGPVMTMLVDYTTYIDYEIGVSRSLDASAQMGPQGASVPRLPLNYVWLETNGDTRALASVRQALSSGPLQIAPLSDRSAALQELANDPLNRNLLGILTLGALAPLALAWIGCLLASWVNIRQRRVLLGVLRALGSTPGQVGRVLLWEQTLMYGAALVLGALFGLLVALMTLPSLVLTSMIPRSSATSTVDLFSLQDTPAARMVVTPSLGLVLGCLLLLAFLSVILMHHTTTRMALAQTLRLNQD